MSDSIDEMIALLSNIHEVTFKTLPTNLVAEALSDLEQGQIDITLMDPPRRTPSRRPTFHELFELSEEKWVSNVVSVKLHSDCLADIRELECFPRLKMLHLDTGIVEIDPEALSEAQIVISEMQNLQNLTIYVPKKIKKEANAYLHWPGMTFKYSLLDNSPKRKRQ
jgi:hypothetical protein